MLRSVLTTRATCRCSSSWQTLHLLHGPPCKGQRSPPIDVPDLFPFMYGTFTQRTLSGSIHGMPWFLVRVHTRHTVVLLVSMACGRIPMVGSPISSLSSTLPLCRVVDNADEWRWLLDNAQRRDMPAICAFLSHPSLLLPVCAEMLTDMLGLMASSRSVARTLLFAHLRAPCLSFYRFLSLKLPQYVLGCSNLSNLLCIASLCATLTRLHIPTAGALDLLTSAVNRRCKALANTKAGPVVLGESGVSIEHVLSALSAGSSAFGEPGSESVNLGGGLPLPTLGLTLDPLHNVCTNLHVVFAVVISPWPLLPQCRLSLHFVQTPCLI